MADLTLAVLKRFVVYDETSGIFRRCRNHGRWKAGDAVGWIAANGYRYLWVDGKYHLEHRLVWLWHHGDMPRGIDHKDGNQLNNRIENLRPADQSQNMANSRTQKRNTSGRRGVFWNARSKKWYAQITMRSVTESLGQFVDFDDAVAARVKAEQRVFGEFARS